MTGGQQDRQQALLMKWVCDDSGSTAGFRVGVFRLREVLSHRGITDLNQPTHNQG